MIDGVLKPSEWNKAESTKVNEQGLVEMGVFGDKLYIPGYDANDGGWDLGNIYIHDGKDRVEKRTVPRAVHIYLSRSNLRVCGYIRPRT